MPRRGSKRKKTRTHADPALQPGEKVPQSLVIRRGELTRNASELVTEIRKMMGPNTATKLKEKRWNQRDSESRGLGYVCLSIVEK